MAGTRLLELAQQVASHYEAATGVRCTVMNLSAGKNHVPQCPFQGIDCHDCAETHRYCANLSFRFGGSYIYFCPSSLLYWSSPIVRDGLLHYAIVAGPVLVFEPDELLAEFSLESSTVQNKLELVTRLPIERIHGFAENLRMCSGWASGICEQTMNENRNQLDQQSFMNEYIQELKGRSWQDNVQSAIESLNKEARLQEAIRCGDKKNSLKLMNELLGMIFFKGTESIAQTRLRIMQLILIISRAAIQGGAAEEEILNISYRCQREINRYSDQTSISQWLSVVLHQITDMVFKTNDGRYGPLIAQAVRFIGRNFDKNVTLNQTAEAVMLSPTYFSKLFNSEMGISFSQYVNKLKIEKSCRFLLDTLVPVAEVAQIAGFTDQSYFSKVFKQQLGMTPYAFRIRGRFYPDETFEIHETSEKE
ncbi:MAG: AraC family transcriptional regulator [Sphaerochaetaceae bacterium]|jgi:AraC-like DNA-binding protein/ligand-binding sensor protein|nr:AraC family transcriptional regulator [Sphaerochaetaceae bacterium]MDD2406254.1 AraC family transcriptional regulator [Sphaerochaetaceae bacterium]MDD4259857.1 AraC family transcriptional regulator [Sphaerochaetaceae bacterium]MDD4841915.1 AraC family transcriptional regulator [Sphaerochaetaceae bacterium]NLO60769.1 AraC family transcriptional regulator [Spirochaetales bacterium]